MIDNKNNNVNWLNLKYDAAALNNPVINKKQSQKKIHVLLIVLLLKKFLCFMLN